MDFLYQKPCKLTEKTKLTNVENEISISISIKK